MNGREVGNGAQIAPDMTGEMSHGAGASGVEPVNVGWGATGRGAARETGISGVNLDNEQRYDAERARGIGGLAMGQVLTYNPEAVGQDNSGVASQVRPEMEAIRSEAGVASLESGALGSEAVQGRNASEMIGVAGENLRQLEHLPEQMRMQNERVREQAEIENGYARNEIAPNLSSVGLASALEEAERRAADTANAMGEFAPEDFADQIQNRSQEEIGEVAAKEIEKLQRQRSFSPARVAKLRDEWMEKMLAAFKNPRKFKERNG